MRGIRSILRPLEPITQEYGVSTAVVAHQPQQEDTENGCQEEGQEGWQEEGEEEG
jgi:hypothetical protein